MTLVALSWLIESRRVLMVVTPGTLIRWHRKGFQLFWQWKSRPRGVRPAAASGRRRSTFVRNHASAVLACDFFVAITANFRVLRVRGV